MLDRWLMDWEEERRPTTGAVGGQHLEWFFDPEGARLIFSCASSGPRALAYQEFWGFAPSDERGRDHYLLDSLVAVLEYWEEDYGAQLVANWGTMLQFVVERPPRTLHAAWPLAREHDLIAGDTFRRAGLSTREHARALIDRGDWLLHSRP